MSVKRHLQIKGDVKMSKSLKNTISITDFLKTYTSNHLRMLCLLAPYRNRIEYSDEAMNTAKGCCHRIQSFVDECQLYLSGLRESTDLDEPSVLKQIHETRKMVETHLADDFNTARVVDEILRFVTAMNTKIGKPATESSSSKSAQHPVAITAAKDFVTQTFSTLGFTFASEKEGAADHQRLSSVLDAALVLRSSVREIALHQDMAASKPQRIRLLQACDQLRTDLTAAGVEVKDHHSQKSTWSLKDIVLTKDKPS